MLLDWLDTAGSSRFRSIGLKKFAGSDCFPHFFPTLPGRIQSSCTIAVIASITASTSSRNGSQRVHRYTTSSELPMTSSENGCHDGGCAACALEVDEVAISQPLRGLAGAQSFPL